MTKTFTITKREGAPDFVWGSFGCKPEDIKDFVNAKGYINFDILRSKENGYYAKVSDFGLKPQQQPAEDVTNGVIIQNNDDDIISF